MADDLAPMTNAEFRELLHRRVEYLLANTYESRHCAYDAELFREAAARLSPPEGDKVEAVARAIYLAQHNVMHDHDKLWAAAKQSRGVVYFDMARAALAALPTPTAGEVMTDAEAIRQLHLSDAGGGAWETYLKPLADRLAKIFGTCPTCGSFAPSIYRGNEDVYESGLEPCPDKYHKQPEVPRATTPTAGEVMREAAALCDGWAAELDGHGRPKEADGARWCARHLRAASLPEAPR